MIHASIKGHELSFETEAGCFSPRHVDRGTLALLSCVEFSRADKILDVGCGYGAIGVLAAKFADPSNVYMLDISEAAVRCAAANAALNGVGGVRVILSDAYKNLDEAGFSLILSNPPLNADFSVARAFIEKGFNRLALGGRFYMVTKRRLWYKNKFASVFGGVKIHEKDGYFVFEAEKRGTQYGRAKSGVRTVPRTAAPR